MSKRFLFMLLYTPAACITALARPYYGLLMLVAMYYFRPDIWEQPDWFTPVKFLTISVLLGWMMNVKGLRWGSMMTLGVLVLLGMCISSLMGPTSAYGSQLSWAATNQVLKMVVVMFLTLQLVDTREKFTAFVWANVLGMVWNVKTILVMGLGDGNMDRAVRVDVGVAQGGGANYLAMVLAMTLPFFQVRIIEGKRWEKRYSMIMAPVYLLCIILTGSRGGFLSMFAAGLFVILRSRRKVMGLTLGAVGLVMFLLLLPEDQMARFKAGVNPDSTKRDFAAQSRIDLWMAGWRIFLRNPAYGVGIDNFVLHSAKEVGYHAGHNERLASGKRSGFVAHSTWFQSLAEGGLALSLPFFGMFALLFLQMGRVKRVRCRDPEARIQFASQATALQGLMVAFMVASSFGSHLKIDFMWWYFGLAGALHLTALEQEARDRETNRLEALAQRRRPEALPEPVLPRS